MCVCVKERDREKETERDMSLHKLTPALYSFLNPEYSVPTVLKLTYMTFCCCCLVAKSEMTEWLSTHIFLVSNTVVHEDST